MKTLNRLFTGIKRHPKRFVIAVVFGYTAIWTILEPLFTILELKPTGYNVLFLILYALTSIIISMIVIYPKRKIKFSLTNTNTKIEIESGDLFLTEGHKVIAVTEFFDSKIGKPVSPKSLHGMFIENILGGHVEILDDAVNNQLAGQELGSVQRVDGKTLKYELGSTVTVNHNASIFFLFALANSNNDCNASSTPSLMLKALDGLWNKVKIEGNGNDINLPLIGNGLSRVGLPPSQLLQLTLISILKSAKEKDFSSTIRIVLTEDILNKIDLEIIKNNWQ